MALNVIFNNWSDDTVNVVNKEISHIKTVEVSYDGGRFHVCVNGIEVFNTYSAGNDCNVELKTV